MIALPKKTLLTYAVILIVGIVCVYAVSALRTVPAQFPVGTTFTINENESLRAVSKQLEDEHIIFSAFIFRIWVSFINKDRHVQLGVYEFPTALTLEGIVKKLVFTGPDHPLLQVTIPEGSTTREIVENIITVVPNLSLEKLLAIISSRTANGRLFPSTYFLLPSVTEEKVIDTMMMTFDTAYSTHFSHSPIPILLAKQNNVIILASILEGEAKTPEDMKIVAGILLKRLRLGMPLQVDVAKETYIKKGLPKVPINNPGLTSLEAALYPTPSEYLYYITGKDGTMYYAKTFEEHKKNIKNHLR